MENDLLDVVSYESEPSHIEEEKYQESLKHLSQEIKLVKKEINKMNREFENLTG